MDEPTYRKWDVALKIVAPILTVAALLVGVWQFTREQAAQLERQYQLIAENDRLEFKQRVWEKQLDTYMKISSVVGRIASRNQDKKELMKDVDQFNSLYWGDMIYVEDETVERSMIDFHVEVEDFLKGDSDKDRLKIRADSLVKACRESSKRNWFAQSK